MNPAIFIDEHCVLSFEIANAKWRPERNKSINQWARPENCASNPSGVDVGLSTEWWKRPIKCPTPPTCCHLATVASSRHCRKQRKIPNFADYYTHKTRRRSVASPPVFFLNSVAVNPHAQTQIRLRSRRMSRSRSAGFQSTDKVANPPHKEPVVINAVLN